MNIILEAEHATLTDLYVEDKIDGYSGNGYVMGFTNDTGTVTFAVHCHEAGLYTLTVGFATPHGEKSANFLLNDEVMGEIKLAEIEGFSEASAGSVYLEEGINKISIEKGWGWYAVDYIKLEPASIVDTHQVDKNLINPKATKEAKMLFRFLVDHYGKKFYPDNKIMLMFNI